ncbi:MAG: heliorhodopsin HeR [Candidatus Thermoplasmatota archaeon]|nr:heliorhodopsin HeR [Candidatus Thermoplasmatota archaeon]MBS3789693.1 heliorhodopsin HeR [Candidatus Thermoplasmatota archaeon]
MNKNENKFKKLRRFNGFMAILHFVQGVLMLYLSNDFAIEVTSSYIGGPPGTSVESLQTNILFELQIGPAVAAFLFMSAIAHFVVSTFGFKWYKRNLKNHVNRARWIEYSFSSSLMIVVIGMLVGITDIGFLIVLSLVNASMILFGWLMETYNQRTEKVVWTPFIFGCIAGVAPWIAIAAKLLTIRAYAEVAIPDFVLWIFVSIAIFFNIFALNQLLQYKGVWKWKDYLYGEKMYIVLSLVAKSALAWQVFSGTLAG